jgi:hypothetical protein
MEIKKKNFGWKKGKKNFGGKKIKKKEGELKIWGEETDKTPASVIKNWNVTINDKKAEFLDDPFTVTNLPVTPIFLIF